MLKNLLLTEAGSEVCYIMIKKVIQQEETTILNIYASNIGAF